MATLESSSGNESRRTPYTELLNCSEEQIIREMKFTDFRRAYMEDGLSIEDFDWFGPSRRTLRQFIAACHELDGLVRDFLLPNPYLM